MSFINMSRSVLAKICLFVVSVLAYGLMTVFFLVGAWQHTKDKIKKILLIILLSVILAIALVYAADLYFVFKMCVMYKSC